MKPSTEPSSGNGSPGPQESMGDAFGPGSRPSDRAAEEGVSPLRASIPIASWDEFDWMRATDQLIEQANETPWVWRKPCLSILGPSVGMPKEWLLWRKQHTHYVETMDAARALLSGLGFIDLRAEFRGELFIPEYWRPTDGAWADACDGLDGPQITALTRGGDEIDLAQGIEAQRAETHLAAPSLDESPVPQSGMRPEERVS